MKTCDKCSTPMAEIELFTSKAWHCHYCEAVNTSAAGSIGTSGAESRRIPILGEWAGNQVAPPVPRDNVVRVRLPSGATFEIMSATMSPQVPGHCRRLLQAGDVVECNGREIIVPRTDVAWSILAHDQTLSISDGNLNLKERFDYVYPFTVPGPGIVRVTGHMTSSKGQAQNLPRDPGPPPDTFLQEYMCDDLPPRPFMKVANYLAQEVQAKLMAEQWRAMFPKAVEWSEDQGLQAVELDDSE